MGKIADKYKRRVARVGPETAKLRGAVGTLLYKGLQEATQEQLYDRTPLKVSRAMYRSISIRFLGYDSVLVMYDSNIARHAAIRLNKRGISKLGGHIMDMHPSLYLRTHVDPQIRILSRSAQRRIINV